MTREDAIKRYKEAYLKLASGQFEAKDVRDLLIILNGEMSNLQNLRKKLKEKDGLIAQLMATLKENGLNLN